MTNPNCFGPKKVSRWRQIRQIFFRIFISSLRVAADSVVKQWFHVGIKSGVLQMCLNDSDKLCAFRFGAFLFHVMLEQFNDPRRINRAGGSGQCPTPIRRIICAWLTFFHSHIESSDGSLCKRNLFPFLTGTFSYALVTPILVRQRL